MKQKKNLWVNLLFAAVVLVIAGVLFYLRSAGQSGSTLGAELIYGNTGGMIGRTNEKQQNIGIFMAVAAHGFMFSSG